MTNKGKLIVICGIDGSGKTTLEDGIAHCLREQGINVLQTKQPSDRYRNDPNVRSYLDKGTSGISMEAMALLSAYDRITHIEEVILPALESGTWVLCNRYVYSAIAYFKHRGVDVEFVKSINSKIIHADYAFLTDLSASIACERVKARDGSTAKFEEKNIEFMESVRNTLLEEFPHNYHVLDGTLSKSDLLSQAMDILKNEI
ncbi:thymidylate kinase (plasmid) [Vibrio nigripulchritudo]|uniref:dTMP kinase n=1 Tax=Vibrio nigripulchritudo TaxID=28173 RepID=UPI00190B7AC7|nr:dTMP kinase [Vibrio nigripulchritudo]BCL73800.1 thymidylate kinase [Vibrio nigripulchritudo]BDU35178.1 thymidylate kinase [Vibrio nigripulchritudo]